MELTGVRTIHRIHQQETVMPYILSLPSDRIEQMEERYRKLPSNHYELVAERDGEVIGHAALIRQTRARLSHNGLFYIAVDSGHHGKGIGSALIIKILDLADNWLKLERVELGVLATNPRAKALYERLGFAVEGIKKGAIRRDRKYVDEILMARVRPDGALLT